MTPAWLVVIVYASALTLIEMAVCWDKIGTWWERIKTGIMNTVKWVCWIGACMGLGFAGQQVWAMRKDLMYQFRAWLKRTENRLARAAGPSRTERRAADLKRKIDWLEHISDQWHELRMQARTPMWTEAFGWIDDVNTCPCGYVLECAIWCGDGSCHPDGGGVVLANEYVIKPDALGGVTAKEFADNMMLLAGIIGPGRHGS
jgi:hypothetical protein